MVIAVLLRCLRRRGGRLGDGRFNSFFFTGPRQANPDRPDSFVVAIS